MIYKAIYELLKSYAGGRVYNMNSSQNASFPYIVMSRNDFDVWRSINAPSAMVQVEMGIDLYADNYGDIESLEAQVISALDGYRGTVEYGTDSPRDYIRIAGITLQDLDENVIEDGDILLYNVNLNFLITYERN